MRTQMQVVSFLELDNMHKLPIKLYRAAQVRELDRIAIQERGIPGFELMSRAGYAVFQCFRNKWPYAKSVAVFCGSGNNAGDGYVIARLILEAGLSVAVYSVPDPGHLAGDALTAYRKFIEAKGVVIPFHPEQDIEADVTVDALLGTGLDRPITGAYAEAIAFINRNQKHIIAVDIPSGLNADTGNVMGCAVKAECTVSFIGLKQGLFTGQADDYCGEVFYASLAVPDDVFESVPSRTVRVIKTRLPNRDSYSHKGNYGHVLIIGGDQGLSGAARMAGEAALRVGSGLVSIATWPGHAGFMNLNRPELMCHGVENAGQLRALLEKADVIVVGPGLGQSDWSSELFKAAVNSQKPSVMDADGLNLLSRAPFAKSNWILTPHPGEAGRLLQCPVSEVQRDRFASAAAIQAKFGGVAILKGSGTLIASDHELAVSTSGNPGMASGGMGDVLTGVIAGLLAQGFPLKEAAQQGVHIHGLAADLAVDKDGERGLLASDLMSPLRQLVNS